MKAPASLDDLTLFLAVADTGSLSGAAQRTGTSLPTLSRRMTGLERQLERRLFLRGPKGYSLTSEGRALAEEVGDLRTVSRRAAAWAEAPHRPRVRITSGNLTATHMARHIAEFWQPEADWVPEFLPTNAMVDIARREADIGIRNVEPDQPWLARRRAGRVTMSIYAAAPEVTGFVAVARDGQQTPSQRWLREQAADQIVTTAADVRICIELARVGIGRVILSDEFGAEEPGLIRVEGPIEELSHDRWLVTHNEARHDPPVRAALDGLAALFDRFG